MKQIDTTMFGFLMVYQKLFRVIHYAFWLKTTKWSPEFECKIDIYGNIDTCCIPLETIQSHEEHLNWQIILKITPFEHQQQYQNYR